MSTFSKSLLATAAVIAMSNFGAHAADSRTGQQTTAPDTSVSTRTVKTYSSSQSGGSSSTGSSASSGGGSTASKAD